MNEWVVKCGDEVLSTAHSPVIVLSAMDGVLFEFLPPAMAAKARYRLKPVGKRTATLLTQNPRVLWEVAMKQLPNLMFLLLPLLALILKMVYVLKHRLYMEHLVVAMYSQRYIFVSIWLVLVLQWSARRSGMDAVLMPTTLPTVATIMMFWIPLNLCLTSKTCLSAGLDNHRSKI